MEKTQRYGVGDDRMGRDYETIVVIQKLSFHGACSTCATSSTFGIVAITLSHFYFLQLNTVPRVTANACRSGHKTCLESRFGRCCNRELQRFRAD